MQQQHSLTCSSFSSPPTDSDWCLQEVMQHEGGIMTADKLEWLLEVFAPSPYSPNNHGVPPRSYYMATALHRRLAHTPWSGYDDSSSTEDSDDDDDDDGADSIALLPYGFLTDDDNTDDNDTTLSSCLKQRPVSPSSLSQQEQAKEKDEKEEKSLFVLPHIWTSNPSNVSSCAISISSSIITDEKTSSASSS
jgi:hypothetical protein